MNKRVVINVATAPYRAGQDRLKAALNRAGEPTYFWSAIPLAWPQHKDVPYGFRSAALKFAAGRGYETLLWCDSDIVPIRPLGPLWERIECDGYWFSLESSGGSSSLSLSAFGLSASNDVAQRLFATGIVTMDDILGVTCPPDVFADHKRKTAATILIRDPIAVKPIVAPGIVMPKPKFIPRYMVHRGTQGDLIDWRSGDPAWHKDMSVKIDSEMMGHSEALGEACYEVLFDDDGRLERLCVRAVDLKIREGWRA